MTRKRLESGGHRGICLHDTTRIQACACTFTTLRTILYDYDVRELAELCLGF